MPDRPAKDAWTEKENGENGPPAEKEKEKGPPEWKWGVDGYVCEACNHCNKKACPSCRRDPKYRIKGYECDECGHHSKDPRLLYNYYIITM
jgi:hypothetical protein